MIARGATSGQTSARRLWRAGALAVTVALAGCTNEGDNYWQRLGALAKESISGPKKEAPRREPTRAELNEIPYATIAVTIGDVRTYLVPLADNSGYLNYLDSAGRGIVMLGGAVTGTQALGKDLQAVRFHRDDPIPTPKPLSQWPRQYHRDYQFRLRDVADYSITLNCELEPLARETIEIVEIDFDVMRVSETCTNARRQVVNTYWVEEDTGFIWKSVQWFGPDLGQATIEIIRPYSG